MPEKYYITPNGKRLSESQLVTQYGKAKADEFISKGLAKLDTSGSDVYATPNGNVMSKDQLYSQYGDKADEFISKGLAVKKKDGLPSTIEDVNGSTEKSQKESEVVSPEVAANAASMLSFSQRGKYKKGENLSNFREPIVTAEDKGILSSLANKYTIDDPRIYSSDIYKSIGIEPPNAKDDETTPLPLKKELSDALFLEKTIRSEINKANEYRQSLRSGTELKEQGNVDLSEINSKINSLNEDLSEVNRVKQKIGNQTTIIKTEGAYANISVDQSGNQGLKLLDALMLFDPSTSLIGVAAISSETKNTLSKQPAQFFTGLEKLKNIEPETFKRVSKNILEGLPISDSQASMITAQGAEVEEVMLYQQKKLGKITDEDYNAKKQDLNKVKEDNLLNHPEVLRAWIADGVAEKGDEIGKLKSGVLSPDHGLSAYLFGHTWNYSEKEIKYYAEKFAEEHGISPQDARVQDAIKYLQDNEGVMVMQNSIAKAGGVREVFKGAAEPIRGVYNSLLDLGRSSNDAYVESQSQGNVNVSEKRLASEDVGIRGVLNDVMKGAGQFATQAGMAYLTSGLVGSVGGAVLGRAGIAAIEGDIALGDMAVKDVIGKALLTTKDGISTFITSYAQSYDSNLKSALSYTSDNVLAKRAASINAGLEAATELFLSPLDIAKGIASKFRSKGSTNELLKVLSDKNLMSNPSKLRDFLTSSIKAVVGTSEVALAEIGEEGVTQIGDYITNSYLSPNSDAFQNRDLLQELAVTAYQTGLSMAVPALLNGIGASKANTFAKGSLLVAAQNRKSLIEALDKDLALDNISKDDYNSKSLIINTAAEANTLLPLKENGSKLNTDEKADYIFSRVSEAVMNKKLDESKDQAEKSILENKIKEQQSFREKILTSISSPINSEDENKNKADDGQQQKGQANSTDTKGSGEQGGTGQQNSSNGQEGELNQNGAATQTAAPLKEAYKALAEVRDNKAFAGMTDDEAIKFVADQARGIQADGSVSNLVTSEQQRKSAVNAFGEKLVNAALLVHSPAIVKSAVIEIGGKTYEGKNHAEALLNAKADGQDISKVNRQSEGKFKLSDGTIIDRATAKEKFGQNRSELLIQQDEASNQANKDYSKEFPVSKTKFSAIRERKQASLTATEKKDWNDLSMAEKLALAKENLPEVDGITDFEAAKIADANAKMLLDKLKGKQEQAQQAGFKKVNQNTYSDGKSYIVPTSNESTGTHIEVSKDVYDEWKKLDDAEKARRLQINNSSLDQDTKNKELKGLAMSYAAQKRDVLGTNTNTESNKKESGNNKIQVGDKTTVNGVKYKVVGLPFGKVRVETSEGKNVIIERSSNVAKRLIADKNKVKVAPKGTLISDLDKHLNERNNVQQQGNIGTEINSENSKSFKGNKNDSPLKKKMIVDAKRILSALRSVAPKMKVIIYDTDAEMKSAIGVISRGGFDRVTNTVHINLQAIERGIKKTSAAKTNTVLHEGTHPILNAIAESDPESVNRLHDQIVSLSSKLKGVSDVIAYGESQGKQYGEDVGKMETVVEFISQVANGDIDLSELDDNSLLSKIAKILNDFIWFIGGKKQKSDALSTSDVILLSRQISNAFNVGVEISPENISGISSINDDGLVHGDTLTTGVVPSKMKEGTTIGKDLQQHGELNRDWLSKLIKRGNLSDINGNNLTTTMSDRASAGNLKYKGAIGYEKQGGIFYPLLMKSKGLNKVLASMGNSKLKTLIDSLVTDKDGYAYIGIMSMGKTSQMSNIDSFNFTFDVIEHELNAGTGLTKRVLLREIKSAFDKKVKGVAIRDIVEVPVLTERMSVSEIKDSVLGVMSTEASFHIRSEFLKSLLGNAQEGKSRLISVPSFDKMAELLSEPAISDVDNGDVVAYMKVKKDDLSIVKTSESDEGHHKSYPYSLESSSPIEYDLLNKSVHVSEIYPEFINKKGNLVSYQKAIEKYGEERAKRTHVRNVVLSTPSSTIQQQGEAIVEYADKLAAMSEDERDNVDYYDNRLGYQFYVARKIMPKKENTSKFRKIREIDDAPLYDYDYVANINGTPYGLVKDDPDNEKAYVWNYTNLSDYAEKTVETYISDNEELVNEILSTLPNVQFQGDVSKKITEVLVAPLYDTRIDNVKDANELSKSPSYKRYVSNIKKVASLFGLKVLSVTPNIGGYTHSDTGIKVDELSNLVEFETDDLDAVTRFAAVMGVMTPETQDSTIAAQYITAEEYEKDKETPLRIEMTFKDGIDEPLRLAQESGVDYTFNIAGKKLFFIDFGRGGDVDFSNKMSIFADKLDENGLQHTTEHNPIRSNFITAEDRQVIFEKIKVSPEYEQGGAEFRSLIDEAVRKNEFFIQYQKLSAERSEYATLRDKQIQLQDNGGDLSVEELQRMSDLIGQLTPSIKDTIKSREESYKEAKAEIESVAKEIVGDRGFVVPFGIKKVERATNKVLDWYNANPNRLGDGARTTIIVDDIMDADNVLNEVRSRYPKSILRDEAENTNLGYPKRLLEVRTANGRIAEFQVMTADAYIAKDGMADFPDNRKKEASDRLKEIQTTLGYDIPEGVGHWFYEVHRDNKVELSLRNEAEKLSDIYYRAMLNPDSKSNPTEKVFTNKLSAFAENVNSADKSKWSEGNKAKEPASVSKFLSGNMQFQGSVSDDDMADMKDAINDLIDNDPNISLTDIKSTAQSELGDAYDDNLVEEAYNEVVKERAGETITPKEAAEKIKNGELTSEEAERGKDQKYIDELNRELYGTPKFNLNEQAFKASVKRLKDAGLTEEEVVSDMEVRKKLTKKERALIAEAFAEDYQNDKAAKELQEALKNIRIGFRPKAVLKALSVSNVTQLVKGLEMSYKTMTIKQLEDIADYIISTMDLTKAESYMKDMADNNLLDVKPLLRAKLIVALERNGMNKEARSMADKMATEAITLGRAIKSHQRAYEILGTQGSAKVRTAYQKRLVEMVKEKAMERYSRLSELLGKKDVEIEALNKKIHEITQSSDIRSKLREIIDNICNIRRKK